MADEVATLGFAINSGPLKDASAALKDVSKSAADAGKNVDAFNKTTDKTTVATRQVGDSAKKAGAGLNETSVGAKNASSSLSKATQDMSNTSTALNRAAQEAANLAPQVRGVSLALGALGIAGTVVGASIAVAAAASTKAIASFASLEEQLLVTNQLIKATGGSAGISAEQIEEMATSIGNISEVRKAGIELLKFGTISGDVFKQTLELADDLSATGFGSISTSAEAIGKALQSPIEGLTRLTRAGIIFDPVQKSIVKNFVETGRAAEAQQFILNTLKGMIGGAGAAKDQGIAGAYEALADATQRVLERWGAQLNEGGRITNMIKGIADAIDNINKKSLDPRLASDQRIGIAQGTLSALEGRGGSIAAQARRRAEKELSEALDERSQIEAKLAEATKKQTAETEKATEAAKKAEAARNIATMKATVDAINLETEALKKNNTERAVEIELKKAGIAPGSQEGIAVEQAVRGREATRATESATQALKEQADQLRIQAATFNMNAAAAAKYKAEQEVLLKQARDGNFLAPEQRKNITEAANAVEKGTAAVEALIAAEKRKNELMQSEQGVERAKLEAAMIGATREEQEVLIKQLEIKHRMEEDAARKRMPVDKEHLEALQKQAAEQARWNEIAKKSGEILEDLRSIAGDFAKSFVSGLLEGKSAMDAFVGAADRLGDKLIDTGITSLLGGNIFGALQAGVGVGIKMFTGDQKAKKAEQEAKDTWTKMHEDFVDFLDSMAGVMKGPFSSAISSARREMQQFVDAASKAKDLAAVAQAQEAYNQFIRDQVTEFNASFVQIKDAYASGNTALVSAIENVGSFTDAVRGFVGDTKKFAEMNGIWAGAVQEAMLASQNFALTILDTVPPMSEIGSKVTELKATAQALVPILVELGMTAEAAGAAIQQHLTAALSTLAADLEAQLRSDILDAQGASWYNTLIGINKSFQQFTKDAQALGVSTALVDEWLKVKVQQTINEAQLTGALFDHVLVMFPQLAGELVEFTDVLVMSAQEIAAQAQTLQDRLFAATTDTTTLVGALLAFDRAADLERATIAVENLALLEQVLAAERLNIIAEFNNRALAEQRRVLEEQKRIFEEAQQFLMNFGNTIKSWLNNYLGGSSSPLSPQAAFQQAQTAYQTQYQLTQTSSGDQLREALGSITQYAQTYLDAARSYFGGTTAFGSVSSSVTGQLGALPSTIRPEDLIVDAIQQGAANIISSQELVRQALTTVLQTGNLSNIASSLLTFLPQIDTNTDNGISLAEMQTALGATYPAGTLSAIFKELDGNGNGILEKAELTKAAAQGIKVDTAEVDTNTDTVEQELANQTTSLLSLANIANATINTVNTLTTANSWLSSIFNILSSSNVHEANANSNLGAIRAILNVQNANRFIPNPASFSALPTFHAGGLVGDGNEMLAILQRGEFVMRRAAVDAVGANVLNRINRTGDLGDGSIGALVRAVDRLRVENTRETRKASSDVGTPLVALVATQRQAARQSRRRNAE